MIVRRETQSIEHATFRDLLGLIPSGDAIVLNTTRVFRARLLGTRDSGAPAELLLLKSLGDGRYEAMVHPGGKLKAGRTVHISPDLEAEILETTERRTRIVQLRSTLPLEDAIERFGHVPLPPYITRMGEESDVERYQTVYASEPGSVAAPTAGLHFTPRLVEALRARSIGVVEVELAIGLDTFRPISAAHIEDHQIHSENLTIPTEAADAINARSGNVVAVGTTVVRALESRADSEGRVMAGSVDTRLYITPGYRFRVVDRLITNFHLPATSLIVLVAAFMGERWRLAYTTALERGYRFASFGDAMIASRKGEQS